MKQKTKKLIIYTLLITIVLILTTNSICYCGTPKIINKLEDAFEDIEGWLLKLATPAAAVAVCTGLFMKKFSFGDEERIRTAKKLIRSSLFSYAFVLTIDLVLSAIDSLVG